MKASTRKATVFLIAVLLAATTAGRAEEPCPGDISLERAWGIALKQNQDVLAAREYKNKVRGIYVEARSSALPHLGISGGYYDVDDESQEALTRGFFPTGQRYSEAKLSLDQVLFSWGQVTAAIRGAKVGLATAGDELDQARQAVMRDVAVAFYDVLLAREMVKISEGNLAQKERHLDAAKQRYDAGLATEYDVLAARVNVQNARPAVVRAKNAVGTTREHLAFLLALNGCTVDARGELQASFDAPPALDDALARAISRRPELSYIDHQQQMARELAKVYSAGDKPRADLHGEIGWKGMEAGEAWGSGQEHVAAVIISFPFFDGLSTRGKVAQAESDARTLAIQRDKLKESMRLQVFTAISGVTESAEIVNGLTGTVEEAQKVLSMANKGYQYGLMTRLDVEDAELALLQAQGGLARAKRDAMVAEVNLTWVMGALDDGMAEAGPEEKSAVEEGKP